MPTVPYTIFSSVKIGIISETYKKFERILQKDLTYTYDTSETTMHKGFQAREVSPNTSPRPPVELRNDHRCRRSYSFSVDGR